MDSADDDGRLDDVGDIEIAEAAGWPSRKAKPFVDVLCAVGFLDTTPTGYVLHNWYNYAGKLNARRERNREAMRATRVQHVAETVAARVKLPTNQQTNQPTEPTEPTNHHPDPLPLRLPARAVVVSFEKCFGRLLSPTELELVRVLEDEQPKERIEFALNEAAALNKRSVRYVQRTCERIANDNGTESGSGVSNARQNPHGMANGVRGLESRSAGIARLGRGGKA